MDPQTIKLLQESLEGAANQYIWWFLGAAAILFCKSYIENYVSGLIFYLGSDYNVDDEVYIKGNKKARIVRQTFSKTVFYLEETKPKRRLIVSNRALNSMGIEKVLPEETSKNNPE